MAVATEPTLLDKLREQRTIKVDAWAEFIAKREEDHSEFEARSGSDEFKALPDEERQTALEGFRAAETAFKAENDERKLSIEELDQRITDQEDVERRRNEAAAASAQSPSVSIVDEPLTYRRDNAHAGMEQRSYYRDLALVHGPGITLQTGGSRDLAQERLIRHAQEMDVIMPAKQKAAERRAREQFEKAEGEFIASHRDSRVDRLRQETRDGVSYNPFEARVTPSETQGQGGYFIPPEWLVSEFIPGLRAHLVAAGLCRQMDLPPGTNSINIPKLATLTAVGYQQQNNSGLTSQDWTDTFVNATVKTIGGFSDVALQLLELSPINVIDEVVTTDLFADYNRFLDAEVIHGDGNDSAMLNGGHLLGLYPYTNWAGTNSVTYTDTPTGGLHLAQGVFGPMASKVAGTRFDLSGFKVVVHGSRWFWYSVTPDANGRPIGETSNGGPYNVQAMLQDGLQPEGLVGSLPFLANAPVYIDDNIGVTDTTGGGSGQDYAIAGLFDDAWLFQSPLRTDVFREVLSGSLGVRFRVYNYAAFLVRYGQSFAVATGSGFAKPATPYGDFFR
jgi:hypothetical protein